MTSGPPPVRLERRRRTGPRARARRARGEPRAQRRGGERGDEAADVLDLVGGQLDAPRRRRASATSPPRRAARAGRSRALEQAVHERAAHERVEAGDLGGLVFARRRLDARQPQDALEVEAVAAAGVRGQRAERQALRRRPRAGRRLGQDGRGVAASAVPGAPRAGAAGGGQRLARQHVAERRRRVDAAQHAGAAVVPEAVEQPLGRARGGGQVAAGQRPRDPVDRRAAGPRRRAASRSRRRRTGSAARARASSPRRTGGAPPRPRPAARSRRAAPRPGAGIDLAAADRREPQADASRRGRAAAGRACRRRRGRGRPRRRRGTPAPWRGGWSSGARRRARRTRARPRPRAPRSGPASRRRRRSRAGPGPRRARTRAPAASACAGWPGGARRRCGRARRGRSPVRHDRPLEQRLGRGALGPQPLAGEEAGRRRPAACARRPGCPAGSSSRSAAHRPRPLARPAWASRTSASLPTPQNGEASTASSDCSSSGLASADR